MMTESRFEPDQFFSDDHIDPERTLSAIVDGLRRRPKLDEETRAKLVVSLGAFSAWILAPRSSELIRLEALRSAIYLLNKIDSVDTDDYDGPIPDMMELRRQISADNRSNPSHNWLLDVIEYLGGIEQLVEGARSLHHSRSLKSEGVRASYVGEALSVTHHHLMLIEREGDRFGAGPSAFRAKELVSKNSKGGVSFTALHRDYWNTRTPSLAWIYAAYSLRAKGDTYLDRIAANRIYPTVAAGFMELAGRALYAQEYLLARLTLHSLGETIPKFAFPAEVKSIPFDPPPLPDSYDLREAMRDGRK